MPRFMVKPGCAPHRIGSFEDAVDYYPGDVIESDDDLVTKFPNKFVLLADDGDADTDDD